MSEQVAIVGCGLIGDSWAALMSAYGHKVAVWDPSPAAFEGFARRIEYARAQIGELDAALPATGALRIATSLEDALSGATWVQENAPEKVPLKRELYTRIEAATASDTVIASSTSSLTWTELSAEMTHPHRFVTAHPFNPPHLMPLVEIYAADDAVGARSLAFFRSLRRHPVVLKREAVGHIANRLSSALWREAVHIVAEGIADLDAVDAALVHGPGLRWSVVGAHMAYHLGGGKGGMEAYLSHLGPSQARRWATLGAPSLTPPVCRQLIDGVNAEADGRSVAVLEAARDAALIQVLRAREGILP